MEYPVLLFCYAFTLKFLASIFFLNLVTKPIGFPKKTSGLMSALMIALVQAVLTLIFYFLVDDPVNSPFSKLRHYAKTYSQDHVAEFRNMKRIIWNSKRRSALITEIGRSHRDQRRTTRCFSKNTAQSEHCWVDPPKEGNDGWIWVELKVRFWISLVFSMK